MNANLAFYETFQVERDAVLGHPLPALENGQWNIPALLTLLSQVIPRSKAVLGYEVKHDFPHIGQHSFLVSARRLVHPDNNSVQMLLVFEDVTERRESEATKDLLLSESQHRMRNMLAVVRALAMQTGVEGRSGKQYRDDFLGRFGALMQSELMLWEGQNEIDLAEIIKSALSAVASQCHLKMSAPVKLSLAQVQPLALTLHELVTNAMKHGALLHQGGLVHITCEVREDGDSRKLVMDWQETGGPPISAPEHQGFGSRLIERSVVSELEGTLEHNFAREGLQVHMIVPLK